MLIKVLGLLTTGLLLGMQHSLEADHVAAVSAIAAKTKDIKKSATAGLIWGLGHSSTVLAVGVLVLALKISIPTFVSQIFECLIGVVLIYLGVNLLRALISDKIHLHRHSHGEIEHVHLHSHKLDDRHEHRHQSFMIGMLHGLAGSAGIMLLILSTMESIGEGIFFTIAFGVGTISGMMLSGTVLGLSVLLARKTRFLGETFLSLISAASVGIGIKVVHENWIF